MLVYVRSDFSDLALQISGSAIILMSSGLPRLHNDPKVGTFPSDASLTDSSIYAHQQSPLQQEYFMRVAQLFSLPSQPDVVSKLVEDLVAVQLTREPAAPYLMALVQYLDCLTDLYYGSIMVVMHRVFEQEATKHLVTDFEQLLPHVNWDVDETELSAVPKMTSACGLTISRVE